MKHSSFLNILSNIGLTGRHFLYKEAPKPVEHIDFAEAEAGVIEGKPKRAEMEKKTVDAGHKAAKAKYIDIKEPTAIKGSHEELFKSLANNAEQLTGESTKARYRMAAKELEDVHARLADCKNKQLFKIYDKLMDRMEDVVNARISPSALRQATANLFKAAKALNYEVAVDTFHLVDAMKMKEKDMQSVETFRKAINMEMKPTLGEDTSAQQYLVLVDNALSPTTASEKLTPPKIEMPPMP